MGALLVLCLAAGLLLLFFSVSAVSAVDLDNVTELSADMDDYLVDNNKPLIIVAVLRCFITVFAKHGCKGTTKLS